nr:unnamed protein product [Callosobruchus analis]
MVVHIDRITRALPGNRPLQASALCVHDNQQLMAVGFIEGSLILYSINWTALACTKKCSVLAESLQESHFMIGRQDAIYCYTTDGRGPCYAVDGEKVMLEWFRTYLIIISKTSRPAVLTTMSNELQSNTSEGHLITVLDIHNKFIVFSGKLEPSYVIRKFLDSQHIEKLTMYLQALHKQGHATEDHTTLLLNCYTKLNNSVGQSDSLKEFITSKDGALNYDVDIAIKVCRCILSTAVYNLLFEHYIHVWSNLKSAADRNRLSQKALKLLQNSDVNMTSRKLW